MKTLLLLFCIAAAPLHAKTIDSTNQRHYSIGLEVFQSLVPTTMMHYNYQQWMVNQNLDYVHLNNPAGFGIHIQKKILHSFFGIRAGYISFDRHEEGSFSTTSNNNAYHRYFDVRQKQYQMQLTPYYKVMHNLGKMKIGFGIELPIIYYSKGNLLEKHNYMQYYGAGPNINYTSSLTFDYHMPAGIVTGLMGSIELMYSVHSKVDIGLAFNAGYLWHTYKKQIDLNYTSESKTYNMDGSLYNSIGPTPSVYTLNSNAKLNSVSRIQPCFRLYYRL